MRRIALLILPLILAALACSLTNDVRTAIEPSGTSTPTQARTPQKTAILDTLTASPAPQTCAVISHALTLRAGPGVDFPALDYLPKGETLTIVSTSSTPRLTSSSWLEVQTKTEKTGYINSTYCERK